MYHFVWIPKYRKRILDGLLAKRVEELLRQCAEININANLKFMILRIHAHIFDNGNPNGEEEGLVASYFQNMSGAKKDEFKAWLEKRMRFKVNIKSFEKTL